MLGSGWGSWAAGRQSRLGSTQQQVVRVALCILLFVLCILLICIVVVTVPFVCCSVKLPLFRPTGFLPVSFHSPPHHGGGRGGRVVLLLPVAAETKTLTGAQPEPMSYAMVVLLCRPVPAVAPPACGPHWSMSRPMSWPRSWRSCRKFLCLNMCSCDNQSKSCFPTQVGTGVPPEESVT